jgi:hypothetical protein
MRDEIGVRYTSTTMLVTVSIDCASGGSLSAGAIVGIAVGAAVGGILVAVGYANVDSRTRHACQASDHAGESLRTEAAVLVTHSSSSTCDV